MIGQKALKDNLTKELADGTLARFIIIQGPKGSGKKTLIKEVFDGIYLEDNKIDSVRRMIEMANKVSGRTFVIADCDNMSSSAKSSLLKVLEECPNDNRFILTVEDVSTMYSAIRSRAQLYKMGIYTKKELTEYVHTKYPDIEDVEFIVSTGQTPGDIDILASYDIAEFKKFVHSVVDNIAEVSGANAFKIADRLSVKDGDGKYDIKMFLKVFGAECIKGVVDNQLDSYKVLKYGKGCGICSKYIQQLSVSGINKQFLIDSWILEIRKEWM